jgi:hypothetical protein
MAVEVKVIVDRGFSAEAKGESVTTARADACSRI